MKKYGYKNRYEPKEVLIWKDELPPSDRVDINNKYLRISFPKCFPAKLMEIDGWGPKDTIFSADAFTFTRNESCKKTSTKGSGSFEFLGRGVKKNGINEVGGINLIYRQNLLINEIPGVIYAELHDLYTTQNGKEENSLFIRWHVFVVCKTKDGYHHFEAFDNWPENTDEVFQSLRKKTSPSLKTTNKLSRLFSAPTKVSRKRSMQN